MGNAYPPVHPLRVVSDSMVASQWLHVICCVFSLLACQWLSVNEDWCDQGLNVNNG